MNVRLLIATKSIPARTMIYGVKGFPASKPITYKGLAYLKDDRYPGAYTSTIVSVLAKNCEVMK